MILAYCDLERDKHLVPPGHPEDHKRLEALSRALARPEIAECLIDRDTIGDSWRKASLEDLELVHTSSYVTSLSKSSASTLKRLDPDTYISPESFETALYACGAGLSAIDLLESGLGTFGFVGMRPPGHHARPSQAMGFCLINNVAVAARYLAKKRRRVAIVDWDVHHGNGTQEIFWDDPFVLYVSVHQSPLYPFTGLAHETGSGQATGLTVNIPLPAQSTGQRVRQALEEIAQPQIEAFHPDWILVSSGFDAHRSDPLASMCLTSGDYFDMTRWVATLAPQSGRTIFFLEGGYDLHALQQSVEACLSALSEGSLRPEPPSSGGPGLVEITRCKEIWGL